MAGAQEQSAPPAQVQRAQDKADEAGKSVDNLARQVQYGRFLRLDGHAKKMAWVVLMPPSEAARDKMVFGWWLEWIELQAEFGLPPLKRAPEPSNK